MTETCQCRNPSICDCGERDDIHCTGCGGGIDMNNKAIKSLLKIKDKIEEKLKNLPIDCRICGKRLTMGSSGPDTPTWACSGHLHDDKDGLEMQEGRKFADKHYSDSVTHLEFDQWQNYEMLERILKELLK